MNLWRELRKFGRLDRELKVDLEKINPAEMTIDEYMLFEEGGFTFQGAVRFLERCTNWSREELGSLTQEEFLAVMAEISEVISDEAAPLSESTESESGSEA